MATTGEAEESPLATGHFYGMTAHARGALYLEPRARAVLDVGALHARAVAMDERGKVTGYKMTSQCASGSGQFLENIARYLGVSQAEIGPLSLGSSHPEAVSSICAVLAETDVINMVSRGIAAPDILRGIHHSMAGRFARLLQSIGAERRDLRQRRPRGRRGSPRRARGESPARGRRSRRRAADRSPSALRLRRRHRRGPVGSLSPRPARNGRCRMDGNNDNNNGDSLKVRTLVREDAARLARMDERATGRNRRA